MGRNINISFGLSHYWNPCKLNMLCLCLLLLAATHCCGGSKFVLPQQPCPCATVEKDNVTEWGKSQRNNRVVGGYDAKENKPWVARIWVFDYPSNISYLFGGNLINKRYVLTAAHCICNPKSGLMCTDGKPFYKITETTTVFLGVNQLKVNAENDGLKGDPQYAYKVEQGQVYLPESKTNDIGLLRLERDAVFVKNILQPICLPLKFDRSDTVKPEALRAGQGLEVFTSGWGRLFSACVTDELGPVKAIKCQLPFVYRGATVSGCSRTRTPSAKDRDCRMFKNKKQKEYPTEAGDSIRILAGNKSTTCYSISARSGW